MRDLAPDITRQRLLMEGLFDREIAQADVERYLVDIAAHLGLRTYGSPIVHAPGGAGKDENEGFDAFIPLIDSGISLYVWSKRRFFAVVLFTCKKFDEKNALDFTQRFFAATEVEHRAF
ncbi:MAG TPA: S-adenosylmethionine decarboxylase [Steroidobacteraceae bacterium]|nr:S-adenosylmethionine decarboxylase [Steroidobacteraceae bacterium]